MKRNLRLALLMAFVLLVINLRVTAQNPNPNSILGNWLVQSKEAVVSIYMKDGKLEGKITWLKTPLNKYGEPMKDTNNVDLELSKRPVMGLAILKSFTKNKDNTWENGTVYDPKNGKTYSCKITILERNRIEIRGFIGFSLLGRTEIWTRK